MAPRLNSLYSPFQSQSSAQSQSNSTISSWTADVPGRSESCISYKFKSTLLSENENEAGLTVNPNEDIHDTRQNDETKGTYVSHSSDGIENKSVPMVLSKNNIPWNDGRLSFCVKSTRDDDSIMESEVTIPVESSSAFSPKKCDYYDRGYDHWNDSLREGTSEQQGKTPITSNRDDKGEILSSTMFEKYKHSSRRYNVEQDVPPLSKATTLILLTLILISYSLLLVFFCWNVTQSGLTREARTTATRWKYFDKEKNVIVSVFDEVEIKESGEQKLQTSQNKEVSRKMWEHEHAKILDQLHELQDVQHLRNYGHENQHQQWNQMQNDEDFPNETTDQPLSLSNSANNLDQVSLTGNWKDDRSIVLGVLQELKNLLAEKSSRETEDDVNDTMNEAHHEADSGSNEVVVEPSAKPVDVILHEDLLVLHDRYSSLAQEINNLKTKMELYSVKKTTDEKNLQEKNSDEKSRTVKENEVSIMRNSESSPKIVEIVNRNDQHLDEQLLDEQLLDDQVMDEHQSLKSERVHDDVDRDIIENNDLYTNGHFKPMVIDEKNDKVKQNPISKSNRKSVKLEDLKDQKDIIDRLVTHDPSYLHDTESKDMNQGTFNTRETFQQLDITELAYIPKLFIVDLWDDEEENVLYAVRELVFALKDSDESKAKTVQSIYKEVGGFATLIGALRKWYDKELIQAYGLEFLRLTLSSQWSVFHQIARNTETVQVVLTAMKNFPQSEYLQSAGCGSLLALLKNQGVSSEQVFELDIIPVVIKTMKLHPMSMTIQSYSSHLLYKLSQWDVFCKHIKKAGGVKALKRALKVTENDKGTQTWVKFALRRLD